MSFLKSQLHAGGGGGQGVTCPPTTLREPVSSCVHDTEGPRKGGKALGPAGLYLQHQRAHVMLIPEGAALWTKEMGTKETGRDTRLFQDS